MVTNFSDTLIMYVSCMRSLLEIIVKYFGLETQIGEQLILGKETK